MIADDTDGDKQKVNEDWEQGNGKLERDMEQPAQAEPEPAKE